MALTAVGRDRPGIVAEVARVLYEHGGNLEDSSMTILGGEFAMILIVSVPGEGSVEPLRRDLAEVAEALHLSLGLRHLPQEPPGTPPPAGAPYLLSVYGADRPGIVYRVARLLADESVNITDVNTRVVGEEESLYIMVLEVEVPAEVEPRVLSRKLRELGEELAVEVTMRPLETARL